MNLINMTPWSLLDDLLDTNSCVFRTLRDRAEGRFPPVNVFLGESGAILDVELPGKSASEINLSLEPQAVILAELPPKADTPKADTATADVRPVWSRRIELPFRLDADKASARFLNGILRIELPKAEKPALRQLPIGA